MLRIVTVPGLGTDTFGVDPKWEKVSVTMRCPPLPFGAVNLIEVTRPLTTTSRMKAGWLGYATEYKSPFRLTAVPPVGFGSSAKA